MGIVAVLPDQIRVILGMLCLKCYKYSCTFVIILNIHTCTFVDICYYLGRLKLWDLVSFTNNYDNNY